MKQLCTILALALFSAAGCGSAGGDATTHTSSSDTRSVIETGPHGKLSAMPWWESGFYAENYARITSFGHAAGAADDHAVRTLVSRYYAAAAARDSATQCSLFAARVAGGLAEQSGRAATARRSCSASIAAQGSHTPGAEFAKMTVGAVRVDDNHGFALMRIGHRPGGTIAVEREDGMWRIGEFIQQLALLPPARTGG